ncbi:hypothetical protein SDC9_197490 [bioreactor metagenome]|uniref:Uncharacterized protein n=1 Tax=bioreactor metagenome TaxID=1076179 RepID=A0A645IFY0_9ZZZZ
MNVITRHGRAELHPVEIQFAVVIFGQRGADAGIGDVACGHRGADEPDRLEDSIAAAVKVIAFRHSRRQFLARFAVDFRALDFLRIVWCEILVHPRQPPHEVDFEVFKSGLLEVLHDFGDEFPRRRMGRVDIIGGVVGFPWPFLRIGRVTGHCVRVLLIKPARFRDTECTAP